jgi:uncharacterized membrane protein YkgB
MMRKFKIGIRIVVMIVGSIVFIPLVAAMLTLIYSGKFFNWVYDIDDEGMSKELLRDTKQLFKRFYTIK